MNTQTLLSRAEEWLEMHCSIEGNDIHQNASSITGRAYNIICDMKAALEEREWKSIELAPKDGTYILGIRKGYEPQVTWWHNSWKSPHWRTSDMQIFDKYAPNGEMSYEPEYWQPLPKPPTGE